MVNIIKRDELPNFKKLSMTVDIDKLKSSLQLDNLSRDGINSYYLNKVGGDLISKEYLQVSITEYNDGDTKDERNYNKIVDWAKGTYIEEVLNMFQSPYTRARIIIKKPGSFILPHIDYNTTYSVRYYIPLVTNEWAMTAVQRREDPIEIRHLKADGSVWFVNPGFTHSAWNFGKTDDIRLIVSVNGQDDL